MTAAAAAAAKSLQSCLTLCDPIDSSPPGTSVHGIFQARVLEWVGCHCLLLHEESRGLHKIRACSQESMTRNKGVRILISSSRIVSQTVIGWRQ